MRLIKNTTELIGIKDQNIKISLVFETDTHIEIQAKLDYPAPPYPHCHGKMIKYDFQRPSKIPLLEQAGTPTLLRLKKRRFQCKNCRRVTVAETSIVEKNCQISNLVRQKVTQLLTEKVSLTDIARRLRVSNLQHNLLEVTQLGLPYLTYHHQQSTRRITIKMGPINLSFC